MRKVRENNVVRIPTMTAMLGRNGENGGWWMAMGGGGATGGGALRIESVVVERRRWRSRVGYIWCPFAIVQRGVDRLG